MNTKKSQKSSSPTHKKTVSKAKGKTSKKSSQKRVKKTPVVLVILDGFGLADEKNKGNAITKKTAPNIFAYMHHYPTTTLTAHGEAVGLFKDQEGNSEAGHFNIGAGRVVEQDLVRISHAISDGTFFKNPAFEQATYHAQKYKSAVHVMGLLTDSQSAHARPEHLYATLEYLRKKKIKKVYLHLFTDGRDAPPHSAVMYLKELRARLLPHEIIASISGRFYAMDRGKNWERTQQAYAALTHPVGTTRIATSAEEAIMHAYNNSESDEYILPTAIVTDAGPVGVIQDNDTIFFFNARSDRARQLTKVFVQKEFVKQNPGAFVRRYAPKNIRFVAMTDFGPDLDHVLTAFPSPDVEMCLARAIGLERKQLYISESEKYAHVTYFLNGGYPQPIDGEKRELVQSSDHMSYADHPQMQIKKVVDTIIHHIEKEKFDFVCVNLPNADMVGHTGNFAATKQAVTVLDRELGRLVDCLRQRQGLCIVTADHGNAEEMIDLKTGHPSTEHTINPVPFILVSNALHGAKLRKGGALCDVAPTVLELLQIKKPKEMTGKSLF